MSSLICGSCFIQTSTLRICFGLAFVMAAHPAQSEEGSFAPDLDILPIQSVRSGADWLHPYQFSASVVLTRSPGTAPIGLGFGSTPQLSFVTKPQPETVHAINGHFQQAYDGDRVSLPFPLHIEFKVEQVNIAFRPKSVLFERESLKITFRRQSALIEDKRFKIMLQPHSALMLWSKAL